MPPHLGWGANQSVEDAFALAGAGAEKRPPCCFPAAF
jgi:2-polyprenyl-6-methoxyphenol hydroxylase-like FAD-dependent oxidoreductase